MVKMGSKFANRLARLERATGNVDPREISILDVHRLVDATEAFERGELSGEELAEAHAEVSRKRTGPFARDMLALARKRSEQQ